MALSFSSTSPTIMWDCIDRQACINGRPVVRAASRVANLVHAARSMQMTKYKMVCGDRSSG
jgi:hypothetical protein